MNQLLSKLHARVGDLWWYSAMIFLACRSGDAIQAFIGLWLVPKYVGPQELGAVLPLQQLSTFFAIPLAIIATVFAKYVNTYATRGEYGKVKSFIHDVLTASILVFAVCIAAAYVLLPHFYERLHVASGALTILILASGFLANVSQLFNSALQGLKKFNVMTFTGVIVAPIRLVTMLVAMPFRALSGYMLGQTTPSAAAAAIAAWDLHRGLKAYKVDTSWRNDWREMVKYMWPIAIYTICSAFSATISTMIYRQRLPEAESAAYYMLSRFSDIAGFVGTALIVVLFPLASENNERHKSGFKTLLSAVGGIAISTIALSILASIASNRLFSLNALWLQYAPYANILPLMVLTTGTSSLIGAILSFAMASRKSSILYSITIINAFWTAFLVTFTGYKFFYGIFPDSYVSFMEGTHLATIGNLIKATFGVNIFQIVLCMILIFPRPESTKD